MSHLKTEEKYPLLFYFVDGQPEISRTNKRLYFDKGRWHGIHSGAASILTEWPNQLGGFWTTILLTILVLFLMMLMYVSTITIQQTRYIRCTPHENFHQIFDEKTVHIVHYTGIWSQSELETMNTIVNRFPKYKLNLVEIISKNSNISNNTASESTQKKENNTNNLHNFLKLRHLNNTENISIDKKMADFKLSVQLGARRLLDILLNNRRNINGTTTISPMRPKYKLGDILSRHHHVITSKTTFEKIFINSPLQKNWHHFNMNLKIFAARILYLWQNGGISFDLNTSQANKNLSEIIIGSPYDVLRYSNRTEQDKINNTSLQQLNVVSNYINKGPIIEQLEYGMVLTDIAGLHFETKNECHAFFEEVLLNLKKVRRKNVTVKYIMWKTLKVFCKRFMVSKEYCKNLKY